MMTTASFLACTMITVFIAWVIFKPIIDRRFDSSVAAINSGSDAGNFLLPEEIKIRKDWISAFFIFYGSALACFFVTFIFAEGDIGIPMNMFIIGAGMTIQALSLYYFAYVKKGTKWIRLFLILVLIVTMVDIINDLRSDSMDWLFSIYSTILLGYYWVHSKRLLSLNCTLKARKKQQKASVQSAG